MKYNKDTLGAGSDNPIESAQACFFLLSTSDEQYLSVVKPRTKSQ